MKRLFALLLAATLPALAQQDFSKVEITAQKLTDSAYMLMGSGGNLGLSVGPDAVFLIDDQFAPLTARIVAAIAKITPKPVQFVLNTHWHFDHTGGNENFGKQSAFIVAHENVRKRMSTEQFIAFLRMTQPPSPSGALPTITFDANMTFHINGDEVRILHVPKAHTDGDAIVHFVKSDVIHMGDVYFNWMYPFIDAASGGSADGVVAAVDKALAIAGEKTRIIPGHGPLASREDLKAYREMVATVSGRVKQLVREGRKLEEIAASPVSAEFDAKWGGGFIKPAKFAEMLAMELLQK